MGTMAAPPSGGQDKPTKGLSSEKREDIWAILIAVFVLLAAIAAPEAVHTFFKETLYLF